MVATSKLKDMLTAAQLAKAAEDILKTAFVTFRVTGYTVEENEDHDGDQVIRIAVCHGLSPTPYSFPALFAAESEVRDFFWRMGERRFVHIHHDFDDAQTFDNR